MPEQKTMDQKLDEILKILNGNGKIGMCAKVTIMWSVGLWVVATVACQIFITVRMLFLK